jgi:hypothetical protein
MNDEKIVTDANFDLLSNKLKSMRPNDPEYIELRDALRQFQIEKQVEEE